MNEGTSLVVDVQGTGQIFGWLFIGTFVTSIPAGLLFINGLGASWSDMRFIPGPLPPQASNSARSSSSD